MDRFLCFCDPTTCTTDHPLPPKAGVLQSFITCHDVCWPPPVSWIIIPGYRISCGYLDHDKADRIHQRGTVYWRMAKTVRNNHWNNLQTSPSLRGRRPRYHSAGGEVSGRDSIEILGRCCMIALDGNGREGISGSLLELH